MPQFNEGQLRAIHHVNGPMIALAGPGSGKTTTIVYRIKYLIEEAKISPNHILVITFTRASAKEMELRFKKLVNNKNYNCIFGTFHSVFFQILKIAYGYQSSQILTEYEKYNILKQIILKEELEVDDVDELIHDIISEISMLKGEMININHYYANCVGEEVFRHIYKEYEDEVSLMNKIDFDDMLVYCYELLKERNDILQMIQSKYQYILIDEFQDINKIQYEITRLIAYPRNNLFIVGDDDQSIYGFRGAKPEIMLHFKEDYVNTVMTLLDINYRCTKNITEGSIRLIGHNQVRFDKKIMSEKGFEEPILIHHVKNLNEENSHILENILQYKKEGVPFSEMAIILRTNAQARSILYKLIEFNIPFLMRDQIPCIYDHFTVKTVLDYIKVAMGCRDRDLFLRIINKPKRYIARNILDSSDVNFDEIKEKIKDKDWMIERIEKLEYDLKILKSLKPFAAIHFIRSVIGYDEYLREYAEFRHLNVEELFENLDELAEMSKNYTTYDEWFKAIEEYKIHFVEKIKRNTENQKDSVSITTMHSAKGLEFDVVFIVEANEGMTPYKKAMQLNEIEEERRMFYVAMTRAKKHLHIYDVKEYYNKTLKPSRFLNEICKEQKI